MYARYRLRGHEHKGVPNRDLEKEGVLMLVHTIIDLEREHELECDAWCEPELLALT